MTVNDIERNNCASECTKAVKQKRNADSRKKLNEQLKNERKNNLTFMSLLFVLEWTITMEMEFLSRWRFLLFWEIKKIPTINSVLY